MAHSNRNWNKRWRLSSTTAGRRILNLRKNKGPRKYQIKAERSREFVYHANLPAFFSVLEDALDKRERDFYLDTNFLRCGLPRMDGSDDISSMYLKILGFNGRGWASKRFSEIYGSMWFIARKYAKILDRENVFVTPEVLGEYAGYRSEVRDKAGEELVWDVEMVLGPLNVVYKALQRMSPLDAVADPLVERIARLVPDDGSIGNSAPPSRTDKMLIASPLAQGLQDGREKILFSWDGGVLAGLAGLHRRISEDPGSLDVGDLVPKGSFDDYFEKADFSIGSINQDRFSTSFEVPIRYGSFFAPVADHYSGRNS